jgi:hypothetical protein
MPCHVTSRAPSRCLVDGILIVMLTMEMCLPAILSSLKYSDLLGFVLCPRLGELRGEETMISLFVL